MDLKKTFQDKKVLVTGHTGFKGSWLSIWLNSLGASVVGVSSDIPSTPSNFKTSRVEDLIKDYRIDIRDLEGLTKIIQDFNPDFIFHLAAKALVRYSYEKPLETLSTNAIGTANVLEAVKGLDKKLVLIMITSDKVYKNLEVTRGYKETDIIGGDDPYSSSKGMAELVINSYFLSYFKEKKENIRLGIARAGNVIGGGDWAKDRIVPDAMRAASNKDRLKIRSPNSTRPWQHVLEPLSGYLTLASELSKSTQRNGEAYNFGPPSNEDKTVIEVIRTMSEFWDQITWEVQENEQKFKEAVLLQLNCEKAKSELDWTPTLSFIETLEFTVNWYKYFHESQDESMISYCLEQIEVYTDLASKKLKPWSI